MKIKTDNALAYASLICTCIPMLLVPLEALASRASAPNGSPAGDMEDQVTRMFLEEARKPLPTDSQMISRFHEKRACFAKLVLMVPTELALGIWRIRPSNLQTIKNIQLPTEEQEKLLPQKRWNTYRHLFACAGIDSLNGGVEISKDRVNFIAETRGFAGSGFAKLFVWSKKNLPTTASHLDSLTDEQKARAPVVYDRLIEGSWYLELDLA